MLRHFNQHVLADGERPVYLVGGGGYGANTDRVANNHADIEDYLAHYRSLGLNYTRSFCIDPWSSRHFSDALFPWARVPAGASESHDATTIGADGLPRFDLDRWDEAWWNRLHRFLTLARNIGMYVQLCVFDHCGLQGGLDPYSGLAERWRRHPFNPDNHVDGLELPGSDGSGRPAFYDLGNRRLIAYQERFFGRLLAETAHLGHVNYQICNEYIGPWSWTAHWIEFARRWEAEQGFAAHTVLVGSADFHAQNDGEPLASAGLDFVDIHGSKHKRPSTSADYHDAFARLWQQRKPLTMDECNWWLVRGGTPEPDATVRLAAREFWGMALAGAAAVQHKEREECAGPTCPRGYGDPVAGHRFDDRLEARLGHLCRFMNEGAPIWADMTPADRAIGHLPPGVAGGYCLAGTTGALVFLWRPEQADARPHPASAPMDAAEGTLRLALPAAATEPGAGQGHRSLSARWFDPETGEWQAVERVAAGDAIALRLPAFDAHIALRIETPE
jgi:hypothetical protein